MQRVLNSVATTAAKGVTSTAKGVTRVAKGVTSAATSRVTSALTTDYTPTFVDDEDVNTVTVTMTGNKEKGYVVDGVYISDNIHIKLNTITDKELVLHPNGNINKNAINMAAQPAMGKNENSDDPRKLRYKLFNNNDDRESQFEYDNPSIDPNQSSHMPILNRDSPGGVKGTSTSRSKKNAIRRDKDGNFRDEDGNLVDEDGDLFFNGGYNANKRSRTVGSKGKTIRQPRKPNRRSRRSRLFM